MKDEQNRNETDNEMEGWRRRFKRLQDEGVFDSPEFHRTYIHAVYRMSVEEWEAMQAKRESAGGESPDDTLDVFLERMDRLIQMAEEGHPAFKRAFPNAKAP